MLCAHPTPPTVARARRARDSGALRAPALHPRRQHMLPAGIPSRWRRRFRPGLYAVALGIRAALRLRMHVQVRWEEPGALRSGTLLCANHQRDADGPLIATELGLAGAIFAASADMFSPGFLYRYAFHEARWAQPLRRLNLAPVLRWLGCVPVPSRAGREALRALEELARRLEQGEVVYFTPEGALTPDGRLQEFRAGYRYLARRARQVVPVRVTYDVLAWQRPRAYIRVGRALPPPAPDLREWLQRLTPVTAGGLLARQLLYGDPVVAQVTRLRRLGAWLPVSRIPRGLRRVSPPLLKRAAAELDELEAALGREPAGR